MSFDRVLPRPPALYDEPGARLLHRQSSSLLEHKIMNMSERTRAAAMSLVSVGEIPTSRPATEPDNCSTALSQMQLSAINREQVQNGHLTASFSAASTRQNTPVLATVESTANGAGDRSASRSPTRLEAAKEVAAQFCLCQPDPKIPRPRNAFILYRQHYQGAVVAQNPGLANPEISKIIGEQWRSLSPESKDQWKALAEAEKARHQQQYPDYRYQPRRYGRDYNSRNGSASGNQGSTTCSRCGGKLMSPPSTPHTPLTATIPPTNSRSMGSVSPHARSSSSTSSFSSRGNTDKSNRRPNELLIPTDTDRRMFSNQWKEPESAPVDNKRRRLNGGTSQRTESPDTEPYSLSSQKTYVSRPGVAYFRSHVEPMSNTGFIHQQQQPPRHEGDGYYDPSLTLPPLKADGNSPCSSSATTRIQTDRVMIIPVLEKIKLLAKISPPLSERDNKPSRGAVIAVDGQDAAQVKVMMKYLGQLLMDDGKYVVRVFEGPEILARNESAAGEMKDAMVEYMSIISNWHRISNEIIQFISPKSSGSASSAFSESSTACNTRSPESSGSCLTASPSPTLSQYSASLIPIALVPRYQLTAADAFACKTPVNDCYTFLDHWQWMASLWRGCIGPDVIVHIRDCEREEIERHGPGNPNPVEIRLDEARTLIIRRVPNPSKDIEEKALRRVGFEIEDFLTR